MPRRPLTGNQTASDAAAGRAVGRTRERDVLVGVLDALAILDIPAQRQNTGAALNPAGKLVRFGRKGNADITATIPRGPHQGKRLEIEIKRPGQYPRPEQVHRMRQTLAAGGIAFWCNDASKCLEILQCVLDGWSVEVDDRMNVWVVSPDEAEGGGA